MNTNTLNRAIQDTSIESFYSLSGVTRQQYEIFKLLKESGALCDRQIAARLKRDINVVCGRRNELFHDNRIEIAYKGPSPYTGKTVLFWQIKKEGQQYLI